MSLFYFVTGDAMKKMLIVAATAAALGLAGCSSVSKQDVGTGVGAVAGGLAGHALFGNTAGTVIGAAGGAVAGNIIGKKMDKKPADSSNQ
jgi:osmotically inducible lipoprotein OsmB